jgi:hypothetical protein
MSDRSSPSYPIAVTDPRPRDQQAVARAALWVSNTHIDVGGEMLIYAPARFHVRDRELAPWAELMRTETWTTLAACDWHGGPVLAAWPDEQRLALIAGDRRTAALCVVPWTATDVSGWAAAFNPVNLTYPDALSQPYKESIDDYVVVAGLQTLTAMVNHSNHLAGSPDQRDAVAVLTTLHNGGHHFDPDNVYAWALAHGWPPRAALHLKGLASKISSGVRPRLNGPYPLRPDILTVWRRRD